MGLNQAWKLLHSKENHQKWKDNQWDGRKIFANDATNKGNNPDTCQQMVGLRLCERYICVYICVYIYIYIYIYTIEY